MTRTGHVERRRQQQWHPVLWLAHEALRAAVLSRLSAEAARELVECGHGSDDQRVVLVTLDLFGREIERELL